MTSGSGSRSVARSTNERTSSMRDRAAVADSTVSGGNVVVELDGGQLEVTRA